MKILICFILILGSAGFSFSEDRRTEENRKKIIKINAEIKEKISKQYKLYEEEKNLLFQIQRYDQKLDDKKKIVQSYNKRLAEIEAGMGALKRQLGSSGLEIIKLEENLKIRMLQVYQQGKYKNLKLLMSALSLRDFIKRYNYLVILTKKDLEIRNKYLNQKNSYNSARKNLEARYDYFYKLKKEASQKENELLNYKEDKKKLLTKIFTEKTLYEQALAELKAQSLKLEDLVNEIETKTKEEINVDVSNLKGDVVKNKGKLDYPVKGELISGFGKVKHPKFNAYVNNNGIELLAKPEQEVTAVFSGIVLFADWFKGYGKTVLVDCGDNVIMIYGHFSEILVNAGQKVAVKQIIGRIGENSATEKPTLYFEIRKDGKPENPVKWLKNK